MSKRERNKDNNVLIVEISFALHAYTAWKYLKRIPYKNKNEYIGALYILLLNFSNSWDVTKVIHDSVILLWIG